MLRLKTGMAALAVIVFCSGAALAGSNAQQCGSAIKAKTLAALSAHTTNACTVSETRATPWRVAQQQCCCGGGMGCSGSGLPKCPNCN